MYIRTRYNNLVFVIPSVCLCALHTCGMSLFLLFQIYNDPLLRDISTDTTRSGNPSCSRQDTPTTSQLTTTEHTSTRKRTPTTKKNIGTRGTKRVCEDADTALQEAVQQLRALSSAEEITDVYSDFGNVVAHDLRQMSEESRIYAQRYINEILFLGKLGKLSASTMIVSGD